MKKIYVFLALYCFMMLTSCQSSGKTDQFLGSYTPDKTYSYDHNLYAVQTVVDQAVIVTVYKAGTNEETGSFSPARSDDFWGICWEKDSYNIWTQSADTGVTCFEYQNGKWVANENLDAPEYIISKYNKEYENNTELREKMYKSPTR